MHELTDKQKAEYLHRSYTAVDGLWFVKVEEAINFKTALDIDAEVWKIMPKIQARMLKSMTGAGDGLEALKKCLEIKFTLDGFKFRTDADGKEKGFSIFVEECPWLDAMKRSKRESLADAVGKRICICEFSAWANEFGTDIHLELVERLCGGSKSCIFKFSREKTKVKTESAISTG
jgi:hypothetical protein